MADDIRAVRAIALNSAIAVNKDPSTVLETAQEFLAFLNGAEPTAETTPAPAKAAATSAPTKTGKPSAPAKAAAPQKPAKAVPTSDTTDLPTQETIGGLVEQMLKANKRKEAVALMAKIGGAEAKSVTSLMASGGDLSSFVEEAETILLGA